MSSRLQLFSKILLLISLSTALLFGCSKDKNKEKVHVSFSFQNTGVTGNRKIDGQRAILAAPAPTGLADFTCIGLFATYQELPPINFCYDDLGGEVARPDQMGGFVPFNQSGGGSLSMEVLKGPGRLFHVIGIETGDGTCPSIFSDFDENNVSMPYLLGQATADIDDATSNVNITISNNFLSYYELEECNGPLFGWGPGAQFVDCGPKPAYGSIDANFLNCLLPMLDNPYYLVSTSTNVLASTDEFAMDTTDYNLAKIQLTGVTPGSDISFTYSVYDEVTGALLYTGTSSINITTQMIDLDQNSAVPTSSQSSTIDLRISHIPPITMIHTEQGARWRRIRSAAAPNGTAIELQFFEPDLTRAAHFDGIADAYGGCKGLKVAATDRSGAPVDVPTAVDVGLGGFVSGGITLTYYSDAGCSTPITQTSISTSFASSPAIYYTITGSGVSYSTLLGYDFIGQLGNASLFDQRN